MFWNVDRHYLRCSMRGTKEKKNIRAGLYCSHQSAQQWLWGTKEIRCWNQWSGYIDSTPSGFGDGIDDISDLNSQPRPCCGFQDIDTVLEFVLWIRHYQIDLDVRLDEYVSEGKSILWQLIKHFQFLYPSKWWLPICFAGNDTSPSMGRCSCF